MFVFFHFTFLISNCTSKGNIFNNKQVAIIDPHYALLALNEEFHVSSTEELQTNAKQQRMEATYLS